MTEDGGRGLFITLEGGEGAGKSTQSALLGARISELGHEVVLTREPGGSPFAELLRDVILDPNGPERTQISDALLFSAARADHVANLIAPALARGVVVICDRFIDSTRVYQGRTGAVSDEAIKAMEALSISGAYPDLTVILDLPAELGLERAKARQSADQPDRYEARPLAYHQSLRDGFKAIAASEFERCSVVDGTQEVTAVAAEIWAIAAPRLKGGSR